MRSSLTDTFAVIRASVEPAAKWPERDCVNQATEKGRRCLPQNQKSKTRIQGMLGREKSAQEEHEFAARWMFWLVKQAPLANLTCTNEQPADTPML